MRAFRLIFILGLALVVFYEKYEAAKSSLDSAHSVSTQSASPSTDSAWSATSSDNGAIPAKAIKVLEIVRQTEHAPEGYVGGRVFQNREGHLPEDGEYREFDVDPRPREGTRNAERLIVEWRTKKAWYTDDHYRTFTPLP